MRWKLLRRRFSISAPRVIVRGHLPWPLRWAGAAVVLGFSAAIALWAFEFGKEIAGLDRQTKEELIALRAEVGQLRQSRERALSAAHSAEGLLKTELVAQSQLTLRVRELEANNLSLKADLGFFDRLLPANGTDGISIRAVLADLPTPGQMRYQLLVTQSGKSPSEFKGRYRLTLGGTLDGRAWSLPVKDGARALQLTQYARVEGVVDYPKAAVVKTLQVSILDGSEVVRATHTARL
jgi:hypothetical protein